MTNTGVIIITFYLLTRTSFFLTRNILDILRGGLFIFKGIKWINYVAKFTVTVVFRTTSVWKQFIMDLSLNISCEFFKWKLLTFCCYRDTLFTLSVLVISKLKFGVFTAKNIESYYGHGTRSYSVDFSNSFFPVGTILNRLEYCEGFL